MTDKLTGPSICALIGREQHGPNLWRVIQPITALDAQGYPAGWDYKDAAHAPILTNAVQGILLARVSWPAEQRRMTEEWFRRGRDRGQFFVYEADDDIFTSQETHRRVELDWLEGKTFEQVEAERWERIWCLQQCDGVTVTTQRLATIVRSYTNKPVIVVPNAIDLKWFRDVVRRSKRQIPGLTIGWAGGKRHDRDMEVMAEAWGRIARRYPDVTFVVQGHQPAIIGEHVPADRLRLLPWLPFDTYPVGIRQVDIGCAAAADTPFNRCKSNIKVLEYAAAGAAVVASPTLYAGTVDHGYSGFIAEDVGEWEDGLEQLVESHGTRQIMAKRLLKTTQRKYSLAGNLWRWPAAWAQIEAAAHNHRILVGTGGPSPFQGVIRA